MSRLSSARAQLARQRRRGPVASAGRVRMKKISITVDAKVLDDMKDVARRTRRTLSAEVSDALARDLRQRGLRDLIAEFEIDQVPITDDELAVARGF